MRSYIAVLSCIFRVINYFSVVAVTGTLNYSKSPFIIGSLFGVLLNFSIFVVISVQSKAFKKSMENCVERILCRFQQKKKVFYTIRISEVSIYLSIFKLSIKFFLIIDFASIRAPPAQQTKNHYFGHVRDQ